MMQSFMGFLLQRTQKQKAVTKTACSIALDYIRIERQGKPGTARAAAAQAGVAGRN
jgi:hypothetical protein